MGFPRAPGAAPAAQLALFLSPLSGKDVCSVARPFLCILFPWSRSHGCDREGTADSALACERAGSPAPGVLTLPPGAWGTQAPAPGRRSKLSVLGMGALFQGFLHPFQKGIPSSVKFYPHPPTEASFLSGQRIHQALHSPHPFLPAPGATQRRDR